MKKENMMKIWVDDIRPAPEGYIWLKSVNETIEYLSRMLYPPFGIFGNKIFGVDVIDLDHDAGEYAKDGGDYIKILDWLEENNRSYPIHLHTMNPVGRMNMRAIIQKNGWKEI
jgi:hypothetical protein